MLDIVRYCSIYLSASLKPPPSTSTSIGPWVPGRRLSLDRVRSHVASRHRNSLRRDAKQRVEDVLPDTCDLEEKKKQPQHT